MIKGFNMKAFSIVICSVNDLSVVDAFFIFCGNFSFQRGGVSQGQDRAKFHTLPLNQYS
jgi:hypothetical protein